MKSYGTTSPAPPAPIVHDRGYTAVVLAPGDSQAPAAVTPSKSNTRLAPLRTCNSLKAGRRVFVIGQSSGLLTGRKAGNQVAAMAAEGKSHENGGRWTGPTMAPGFGTAVPYTPRRPGSATGKATWTCSSTSFHSVSVSVELFPRIS